MFQVSLINSLFLPNPDPSVKQRPDPFAVAIAEIDSGKYELGRTKICPKTCNPVWDQDASKPFNVSTPNLKKLIFIVYDSNEEQAKKNVEIGRHIINFEDKIEIQFNQLSQLPLETQFEFKIKPTIQIKLSIFFDQIQKFKSDEVKEQLARYTRIFFILTFDPPFQNEPPKFEDENQSRNENDDEKYVNISFLTFDLEDGGRERILPRMCNNDNRGVKVKKPSFALTKSGWTPFASFNLPKLECHLFSQVEMLYLPAVQIKGYVGKVTLWSYGASKDITQMPYYLFSDTIEFVKDDIITSSYVFQPTPNLSEYHIKMIDKYSRSNFQSDLVFLNYMKYVSLPAPAKKFLRLELDVDRAVTLSYASKFHRKSLPAQLVFYTDWMSTAGHPLDLGIEVYDSNFESIDHICADKHEGCNSALTWNVSTDGRFEKFKKDTLFLRVRLSRLPDNVKYLSVALAAYSLKPFPLKYGGFFRLYDEDDMFEYMNLSIRSKGSATGVAVCIMERLEGNDWIVIPTIKKFTIKHGVPGLVQHFRAIGDLLRDTKYLSEITASMNQYELPTLWYEMQENIEKQKEKEKKEEEDEKGINDDQK